MAFSPINLTIQEILQTDFITDLAQIHNSNVLILKDKLEDLINNFEIDINTISIGVDNPINNINTQNVILQDGGFIFQTGIPNQIIARLEKNGNDESVLNVDHLNVDLITSMDDITVNSLTVNDSVSSLGPVVLSNTLKYDSSITESKETVNVDVEYIPASTYAEGRLTLTDTSRKNIYVNMNCETAPGVSQVYDVPGTSLNPLITEFVLYVDFDVNSPPAQNMTFTIYLIDIIENTAGASISNAVNVIFLPFRIDAGLNLATGSTQILLHSDFTFQNLFLGVTATNSNIHAQAISEYGANATFNYIIDANTNDRLMLNSYTGMEIYQ